MKRNSDIELPIDARTRFACAIFELLKICGLPISINAILFLICGTKFIIVREF